MRWYYFKSHEKSTVVRSFVLIFMVVRASLSNREQSVFQ